MSFNTLKTAILEAAAKEAEAIEESFEKRIADEESRIAASAKEIEQDLLEYAEVRGEQEAGRTRQTAELEGRSQVLQAKQEELNTTKEHLTQQLLEESHAEDLIQGLLSWVANSSGTIVPGEKHRGLIEKLDDKSHTVAVESIAEEGGFILQAGNTELNLTIGHLVDQLFTKYRAEIAKELFA